MTKKILAIILAVIMAITAVSATAFAAEVPASKSAEETTGNVYKFVVEPNENGVFAIPNPNSTRSTLVFDNTWEFRNHYTGSTMVFYSNYIQISAKATDFNGSPVGDEIAIELYDSYGGSQLSTIYADGTWYNYNSIPVNYGDSYYFYFDNVTSNIRKIRITFEVYTL